MILSTEVQNLLLLTCFNSFYFPCWVYFRTTLFLWGSIKTVTLVLKRTQAWNVWKPWTGKASQHWATLEANYCPCTVARGDRGWKKLTGRWTHRKITLWLHQVPLPTHAYCSFGQETLFSSHVLCHWFCIFKITWKNNYTLCQFFLENFKESKLLFN